MAAEDGPACHGNGAEHCCWIMGQVCPFLEVDTAPGRHWSCGLKNELGSWDKVHTDPRYVTTVRATWDAVGMADCGDWRIADQCCFGGANPPVHNVE